CLRRTSVKWRLNRSSMLPWHHRVTSDGHLVLLQADRAAEGNYSCHDDRGRLIRTTRLRLGHPPGLLNVSCRVSNHSLVLCSWVESVKTLLPAQYHTSYRGNKSQVRMCVVSSPPQQQCTITDPTMWQHYHNINITETNPLGSQTTILMVKFHELLQPDPPEGVTAVGDGRYPMRLQVYCTYPASWLHDAVPFPLRYRPVGSSIWSTVESKTSPLLITDALAGHAHQLQVRAQDEINPDSQWSDWSPLLQAGPWSGSTAEPTEETFPVDYNDTDADPSTANTKSETSRIFCPEPSKYPPLSVLRAFKAAVLYFFALPSFHIQGGLCSKKQETARAVCQTGAAEPSARQEHPEAARQPVAARAQPARQEQPEAAPPDGASQKAVLSPQQDALYLGPTAFGISFNQHELTWEWAVQSKPSEAMNGSSPARS
ncbi:LOW QUALITY PROTEIN: interleukin-11 receptor subunit alpha, partial [Salvelinus sp. IW2-2015]|uniref:LOW QUALITY PROTEIN: interleukin-11 receptor subunit alpha n=1 Tax=Salvelinus sp. IW2-2015 TaxID=2691554 RepID=UPI0038D37886